MDKNVYYEDLDLNYYTRIPNKNGFYTRIEFEKFEEIIDSTIKVPVQYLPNFSISYNHNQ